MWERWHISAFEAICGSDCLMQIYFDSHWSIQQSVQTNSSARLWQNVCILNETYVHVFA